MAKTQTQLLLDHFKLKPDISALEARALYRVEALPRRVADLREAGHEIHAVLRKDETGKRYTRYFYKGKRDPFPVVSEVAA